MHEPPGYDFSAAGAGHVSARVHLYPETPIIAMREMNSGHYFTCRHHAFHRAWCRKAAGLATHSLIFAVVLLGICGSLRAAPSVDLALVLAVDASGSVDQTEYTLQMEGIAAAFETEEVLEAITSGPHGRIGVNLLVWAEANRPKAALGWHVIANTDGAKLFAAAVRSFGRPIPAGGTGIGKAVVAAAGLLRDSGLSPSRRVIDLSGDGRETAFHDWSVPAAQARHLAHIENITVNTLAIENEDSKLAEYYRQEVMTGPEAFTLSIADYETFADAMQRKLIREITYRAKVGLLTDPSQRAVALDLAAFRQHR